MVLGKAKYGRRPSSTVIGPRQEHGLAASLRKLTDRISGATVQSRKPPLAPGTSEPLRSVTCSTDRRTDIRLTGWNSRYLVRCEQRFGRSLDRLWLKAGFEGFAEFVSTFRTLHLLIRLPRLNNIAAKLRMDGEFDVFSGPFGEF